MTKFNTLKEYFKELADKFLAEYNDSQKFYREHEELTDFPCMRLSYYQGSLTDNGGDGWFQHRELNFDILFHLNNTNDDQNIDDLINSSEEIGLKIINELFFTSYPRINNVQIEFNFNSVSWNVVKNEADLFYGNNFSFTLLVPHPNIENV